MFHVFVLAPPPTGILRPPLSLLMTSRSGNGPSKKCLGYLEKIRASPYVLGLRRISSSSMGLYRDLEKFRTLPFYIGLFIFSSYFFHISSYFLHTSLLIFLHISSYILHSSFILLHVPSYFLRLWNIEKF